MNAKLRVIENFRDCSQVNLNMAEACQGGELMCCSEGVAHLLPRFRRCSKSAVECSNAETLLISTTETYSAGNHSTFRHVTVCRWADDCEMVCNVGSLTAKLAVSR